jgi:hypothetical protein
MTKEEAEIVFKDWQEYVEINDKLFQIFGSSIPKSFLPYPPVVLEEVMNIIAKKYFDRGNHEAVEIVQRNMSLIMCYKDDEEAIVDLLKSLRLTNPELRKLYVRNLQRSRDSWAELKKYKVSSSKN